MTPKKLTAMLSASLASLFIGSAALADDADALEWLFVHTAETAEMTSDTTLVMPVTREIFAFTDRPNRLHTYLNAHEFVSLWDESEGNTFKADPPNAVLTWVDGDGVQEAELVLNNARVLQNGRAIEYQVQSEVVDLLSESLDDNASLFIDSVCLSGLFSPWMGRCY